MGDHYKDRFHCICNLKPGTIGKLSGNVKIMYAWYMTESGEFVHSHKCFWESACLSLGVVVTTKSFVQSSSCSQGICRSGHVKSEHSEGACPLLTILVRREYVFHCILLFQFFPHCTELVLAQGSQTHPIQYCRHCLDMEIRPAVYSTI